MSLYQAQIGLGRQDLIPYRYAATLQMYNLTQQH